MKTRCKISRIAILFLGSTAYDQITPEEKEYLNEVVRL